MGESSITYVENNVYLFLTCINNFFINNFFSENPPSYFVILKMTHRSIISGNPAMCRFASSQSANLLCFVYEVGDVALLVSFLVQFYKFTILQIYYTSRTKKNIQNKKINYVA